VTCIVGVAEAPKECLMPKITPCLWFNDTAEESARFYLSVFKASRLGTVTPYGEAGAKVSGRRKGSVMTATFEIDGQEFVALNGGPAFTFNEAVSFQVHCHTQEEVDHYWNALSAGGDAEAQQCGWLKDRYGVSWQIVPAVLIEMLKDGDSRKANRVMQAVLEMKKIDIPTLQKAYEEKT
jgi:predicted 3-demethylubiquinone-9 3-methyltransferase (glyoxalase superfamily)